MACPRQTRANSWGRRSYSPPAGVGYNCPRSKRWRRILQNRERRRRQQQCRGGSDRSPLQWAHRSTFTAIVPRWMLLPIFMMWAILTNGTSLLSSPSMHLKRGKSGRRSRRDMSATRCQWEQMSSLRTMMESIRLTGGSFIIEDGNQMSLTQQSSQEARQQ